ncbi:ATP-dependent zinc metalloprotease FtsH [Bythopirellula polymerisocia]|uniref:ATP-dependent zinc metalloprotease FtsH n=1 Tax=Bythopirellula polymerisocia TaxID=2528003 RepID=A0A5C6CYI4_9BACT|nr:ATP-dependent zinc metalloprotease FtsH [Bythopirellula polymerisocia]TWU28541.1 ATP-dependent zinc metalloprotease FtsH [Bythopirellula polymerisocia]
MNEPQEDRAKKTPQPRRPLQWFTLSLLAIASVFLILSTWRDETTISYSQLIEEVEAGNVAQIKISKNNVVGEFREGVVPQPIDRQTPADEKQEPIKQFKCTLPEQVGEDWLAELRSKKVEVTAEDPANYDDVFFLISLVGMGLLIVFAWSMMRRTRDQMLGGGMLGGVTKSPARRYEASDTKISFSDVAGLSGVKKDLEEIVLYLKDAPRFQRLGAQVPKGVLLMGPPGTGKTLLARAVAGEAGVPFFSINGSEFIQMFVGVGAGRVRDMFKTAQDNSPAILFIDEIDAVGRQRGAGLGGGHDEREQTLNQILSEMDGFSPTSTVIVLAATNRPDVLDPALLRPGRFDRHITVDRPTVKGRQELFELHSQKVPLTEDVDFEKLARATSGLTGADIRNLVNEAALWAIRHDKDKVGPEDFEYARDKILMGSAREEILTADEKKLVAYHEAGHALVAWLVPDCEPVHKVTIIPRGRSLGVTQLVPEEDRYNTSQSQMIATLTMALAGRAAEKIQFDEFSAGAESDLKRATDLARRMVTRWGMSERLGPVAYSNGEEHPFLGREMAHEHRTFSERTAQIIDEEVAKILHSAADSANLLLTEHASKLEALSQALLDREMLDTKEIEEILGPSARDARRNSNHAPV